MNQPTTAMNKRRQKLILIGLTIILGLISIYVAAEEARSPERFGFSRRWNTTQNYPPNTEVVVARWTFNTDGSIGGFGWAHNYPSSDQNLNQFIAEATGIDIDRMSYRIQRLGDDDVFDYPFAYISEPGEMDLTPKEVENFREFINRGGFVLMDDFDGSWQLNTMRENVRRAFPDREWVALDIEHTVFLPTLILMTCTLWITTYRVATRLTTPNMTTTATP